MPAETPAVGHLTAFELKCRLDRGEPLTILDVREENERALCAIPIPPTGSDLHVPLSRISAQLDDVGRMAGGRPLVVYCHHGIRSMMVASALAQRGRADVFNLDGGIDAWSAEVDPSLPRY